MSLYYSDVMFTGEPSRLVTLVWASSKEEALERMNRKLRPYVRNIRLHDVHEMKQGSEPIVLTGLSFFSD